MGVLHEPPEGMPKLDELASKKTLRDYIAIAAMQGLLAHEGMIWCEEMTAFTWKIADAMLLAREE